jgi:hypothetical protein
MFEKKLHQFLDSLTNNDAKDYVSQSDVRSLLWLAFPINQHLDSLTNNNAKEAVSSQSDVQSLLCLAFPINQHGEIKEHDEDEDCTPELEMDDDDEIDKLEYDPESDDEVGGYYDTRALLLGNKEFDVQKSHTFISCSGPL